MFLERLVLAVRDDFEHHVVSMRGLGLAGERLRQRGIRVDALRCGRGLATLPGLMRLRRLVRVTRPDVVQGWLYHGNLAAWAVLRQQRWRCRLLWTVRHSLDGWREETWQLRAGVRFSGWLADAPARIVFNSRRSAAQHQRLRYPRAKACVIPNGFDLEKFLPDSAARSAGLGRIGASLDEMVFGMVGRFHPLKGHIDFLRAAAIVAKEYPRVKFVLAGRDVTCANGSLIKVVSELGIESRVTLLGNREDVPELMNMFDVYVSASWSEAFPNAVGEAMSCGVPCVVTDAGDSASLVGDTGIVVPVKSPERLAAGILELIRIGAEKRRTLGESARERIRLNYSMQRVAQQYADLYRSVCGSAESMK